MIHVVSGILIGLAIGLRATVAPLALPFAGLLWFTGGTMRERMSRVVIFGAGISLALLPAVWAVCSAPRSFIYGNVEFPKINIEYRFATGEPRTMTLAKKLRFLVKEIMWPNWLLFYGFLAAWRFAAIRPFAPFRS